MVRKWNIGTAGVKKEGDVTSIQAGGKNTSCSQTENGVPTSYCTDIKVYILLSEYYIVPLNIRSNNIMASSEAIFLKITSA
jgi:hypothetical protein